MHQQRVLHDARGFALRHVGDDGGSCATGARFVQRLQRVRRLAGLRNAHHQRVFVQHRVGVGELSGVHDRRGDAGECLHVARADESRVDARAHAQKDHARQRHRFCVGEGQQRLVQPRLALREGDASVQRAHRRLRLLVYLLQREVLETALRGGSAAHGHGAQRARGRSAVQHPQLEPLGLHDC